MANATPMSILSTGSALQRADVREQVVWVVGYLRVSTDGQAEKGFGLDVQRKIIEDYIARFPNWRFYGWYSDDGVSGTRTDRADFNRLLEDAQRDPIKFAVVARLNRQSREEYAGYFLDKMLEEVGASVVSASQDADPYNINKVSRGVQRVIDAEDRRKILEQTNDGRQRAAEAGYWVGGPPPFGYQLIDQGKKRSWLAVYEPEAIVRRRAVELIVDDGLTLIESMDQCNAEGLHNRGGRPWNYGPFYNMLHSEAMHGTSTFRKTVKGVKGKPLTRLAADGVPMLGVTVVRKLPEIIPEDRRNLLWVALAANAHGPRDPESRYLLSGHIIGQCGRHYVGHVDTARRYQCTGHQAPAGERCNCVTLQEDVTNEAIWKALRETLKDKDLLETWAREWAGRLPRDKSRHEANVKALTASAAKQKEKLQSLVLRIEDKELDADEREILLASKETLMGEWKRTKTELAQVQELLEGYDRMHAGVQTITEAIKDASIRVDNLTLHEKMVLIDLCELEVRVVGRVPRAAKGPTSGLEAWLAEENVLVPDEPTDEVWEKVLQVLCPPRDEIWPPVKRRGKWMTHQQAKAYVRATFHRLRTGCTWAQVPVEYLKLVNTNALKCRQVAWWNDGTWRKIIELMLEHGGGTAVMRAGQLPTLEMSGLALGALHVNALGLVSDDSPGSRELRNICCFKILVG